MRRVNMLSNGPYLQSLLDFFYKHIAISSETVHGEHSAVGPKGGVNGCLCFQEKMDGQSENFGGIAGLDAVALALTGVTGDDRKVCTCDGKNCAAIFSVRVEMSLLWGCDGHIRHVVGKKAEDIEGKKRGQ